MTLADLRPRAIALAFAVPVVMAGPSAAQAQTPAERRARFDALPCADFLAAAQDVTV